MRTGACTGVVVASIVIFAMVGRALADEPAGASASFRSAAVVHQRLAVAIEPMGAELATALAWRLRWDDGTDPLYAGTHLELGAIAYVSPADAITGGYVSFSPWALLTLRAELASLSAWPLGELGAGFSPRENETAVGPGVGAPAFGLRASLTATLALAVQIERFRPILHVQLGADFEELGEEPFHFSARHDRVLARRDWMLTSAAHLFLETRLDTAIALRLGAFDDVRAVPRSGHVSHVVGPAAMLVLERLDVHVPEVSVLVRAGAHLDETAREGAWTGLVALFARYEP